MLAAELLEEVKLLSEPVVSEFAVTVRAVVVAPIKVWLKVPVPDARVKLELFCTVTAPFEVKPEVAVIRPEMVGVAVQAVPVTVKLPPRVVKLLPVTVRVPLISSLAPGSVVPMPTLPFAKTVIASTPAAETWKGFRVEPVAVVRLSK